MPTLKYSQDKLLKACKSLTIMGILVIVLGIFALVYPQAFGEFSSQFLGVVLVIGGVIRALLAGAAFSFSNMFLRWLYAALMIVAGVWIFMNPDISLEVLTGVMGVYFIIDGLTQLIYSFSLTPIGGGSWVLINGIIGIAIGILIFSKWPQSSEYAIGVYLGIKLIIDGLSLAITGYLIKKSIGTAVDAS